MSTFSNYTVSSTGLVVTNIKTGKTVTQSLTASGYLEVTIKSDAGKWTKQRVHRLVVSQYKGIPLADLEAVNHIDGVKTNNDISNLEACTLLENARLPRHTSKVRDLPKGIHHWRLGKKAFRVVMKVNGKQLRPAYFEKLEEAVEFYTTTFFNTYGKLPYDKNSYSVA
jgi:hypothetical protein